MNGGMFTDDECLRECRQDVGNDTSAKSLVIMWYEKKGDGEGGLEFVQDKILQSIIEKTKRYLPRISLMVK